jgi:hypothetical protein
MIIDIRGQEYCHHWPIVEINIKSKFTGLMLVSSLPIVKVVPPSLTSLSMQ